MRTRSRTLSVEPVEDRSLPSATFVFVEPLAGNAAESPATTVVRLSTAEGSTVRPFSADTVVRVRFGEDSVLFIRSYPAGFQLIPVFVGTYPILGQTSSAGGRGPTGGDSDSDAGQTGHGPFAPTRGPVQTADVSAGRALTGTSPVALALPTEVAAAVQSSGQVEATVAAQSLAVNGPPAVVPVSVPSPGRPAVYAITAINPEEVGTPDAAVPPPAPSIPLEPIPLPDAALGVESGVVAVAAAAATPVAGLVPFDLTALSAGAGQFLDRVADLAPEWPDAMPGFTDSLWVAAATLLTGGAIHAARTRSAGRPARDPLAGALSEWERRNGRSGG